MVRLDKGIQREGFGFKLAFVWAKSLNSFHHVLLNLYQAIYTNNWSPNLSIFNRQIQMQT